MRDTQYLYGINPKDFADLTYKEALNRRIESAQNLLRELLEEHYQTRDYARIGEIHKAVSFNEKLLKELL